MKLPIKCEKDWILRRKKNQKEQSFQFFSFSTKNEEIRYPSKTQNKIKQPSKILEHLGKRTKIDPIVKPIIPKKVTFLKCSNKYLVIFMKNIPPIAKPIPIGIKIDKFKVEIEDKYN